ncbi:MAG: Gldg family protein [Clostridia bacterium]|nr:Gldg family protein [Clostridia bacterium]
MNNAKHTNGRKLQHGTVNVVLSIVLIVSVILVNAIFTALAYKFNIFTDMTEELVFSLSDEFKAALADVNTPVQIHFCHEPDYLQANTLTKYVYQTALQIAEEFDWVTVDAYDSNKEPTLFAKYSLTAAAGTVSTSSVIIESGDEFRIMSANNFYVVNEDGSIWAYNAEEKYAAAILSVTASDLPVAYFTTKHGETKNIYLEEIVKNAGYEVKYIDLTKEQIESDARLVVINNPVYDFSPEDPDDGIQSELEQIDKFLASEYGSLMVFIDPLKKNGLDNLLDYLSEWGIVIGDTIASS